MEEKTVEGLGIPAGILWNIAPYIIYRVRETEEAGEISAEDLDRKSQKKYKKGIDKKRPPVL